MNVTLITGCSSGIGRSAAVRFAENGHKVVATMRSLERSHSLRTALSAQDLSADIRELDVADDESVITTLASVLRDYGHIDVVLSNAGIGIEGTTEELTLDDFRRAFETNTLGSVRLLQALLPAWRQRRAGRFIAVSSMAGVIGQPFHDAYSASKFALEGMLESIHPVVAQHGVSISVVEPGPVAGDFVGKSGPTPVRPSGGPYTTSRARFQAVQDASDEFAQSNDEIADFLLQVSAAAVPMLRYQTSKMVERTVGLKLNDLSGERVASVIQRWV